MNLITLTLPKIIGITLLSFLLFGLGGGIGTLVALIGVQIYQFKKKQND